METNNDKGLKGECRITGTALSVPSPRHKNGSGLSTPIAFAPSHEPSLVERFFGVCDRKYDALDAGKLRRVSLLNYALEMLGAEVQQALLRERDEMHNASRDLFKPLREAFAA